MKKIFLLILTGIILTSTKAQSPNSDHWEVIFNYESNLKYQVGSEAPESNWNQYDFNDDAWSTSEFNAIGYGGMFSDLVNFGFPDLGLSEITTLYTRTLFTVTDTSTIENLMLDLYYTDGFVAYINGVEVVRKNIGIPGDPVTFDQPADTAHPNNADVYYGYFEPGIIIEKPILKQSLRIGENVLAVELHNDAIVRSDHNYIAWLLAEMNTPDTQFGPMDSFLPVAVDLDSSNLPIIKINTLEVNVIPNDYKTRARMQIIYDESLEYNYVSDSGSNYDGLIGIEYRGSSSINYPKKSFGLETRDSLGENLNVSLLGMPEENDWILYASYSDKTLLRNVLTYKLSEELGHYAPRTQHVELILNDRYIGTYVFMEKIKRDKNRVDVSKLRANEIAGDSLTGGYIIKIDKKEGNYGGWDSEFGSAENETYINYIQYVYPKHDEIVEEQKAYIQNFMSEFENSLRSNNFEDESEGYRKYINVESFIDYFIINEFTKNMDGYRLSTFMYKDRDDKDGKLHMGPVWDYNLALGNYENFDAYSTSDWAVDFGTIAPGDQYQLPFWWDRLLQDAFFTGQLADRWNILRDTKLHQDSIFDYIDLVVDQTHESRERNFNVWQEVFNEYIWPNAPLAENYEGEIIYLKNWITDRLDWIDDNIGETREKKTYVAIESTFAEEYLEIGAYPNPFIDQLTFSLNLESDHDLQLNIYTINGQKISQLVDRQLSKGDYKFVWYGQNESGGLVQPGVYIYTVVIDGRVVETNKIIKQ